MHWVLGIYSTNDNTFSFVEMMQKLNRIKLKKTNFHILAQDFFNE